SALVDLGGIAELAGIRREDGALVVGAMTRQWDLEHDELTYPLLRDALRFVGHTATRCRGTVGGSLVHADPTAELPVCALALGAELVTDRRTIPAPVGETWFREVAHRDGDFAVVCAARNGDRIALGGVGATPVLWDGGELEPIGDLYAPAGYKRAVAERLIAQ